MSGGVLVLVVGPSGAGKDTLIAGARERLVGDARFVFPRRTVTRDATAHEDHDTMTAEQFAAALAAGRFALSWTAHGLSYGIPQVALDPVAHGRIAVCNVSRAVVGAARARLGTVRVVYVDARPELRAARIAVRGREQASGSRLDLARSDSAALDCDLLIDNSGLPDAAIEVFTQALRGMAAAND